MSGLHEAWAALSDPVKRVGDALAIGTVLGTIMNMLPAVASVLSVVYLALRIWELDTVREWTGREKR